ncbi:hypothetical protein BDN72DRAFT_957670 [Pluteus cervinus]|uniref:Uncharacterized protein n=1 Tax=Pluteus cervinus TaxID=181527 RepID=A0ACD3B2E1_9AGAR|nr:hypothetical protein BDN72DRAFT_957670 [Pluteus cervinus]
MEFHDNAEITSPNSTFNSSKASHHYDGNANVTHGNTTTNTWDHSTGNTADNSHNANTYTGGNHVGGSARVGGDLISHINSAPNGHQGLPATGPAPNPHLNPYPGGYGMPPGNWPTPPPPQQYQQPQGTPAGTPQYGYPGLYPPPQWGLQPGPFQPFWAPAPVEQTGGATPPTTSNGGGTTSP